MSLNLWGRILLQFRFLLLFGKKRLLVWHFTDKLKWKAKTLLILKCTTATTNNDDDNNNSQSLIWLETKFLFIVFVPSSGAVSLSNILNRFLPTQSSLCDDCVTVRAGVGGGGVWGDHLSVHLVQVLLAGGGAVVLLVWTVDALLLLLFLLWVDVLPAAASQNTHGPQWISCRLNPKYCFNTPRYITVPTIWRRSFIWCQNIFFK